MPNNEYNGWPNRNMWLINLYFNEASDVDEATEMIEAYMDEYIEALLGGLSRTTMTLDSECQDEESNQ